MGQLGLESVPAACLNESEDRDEKRAAPDEHELQNFIEDGRPQSAERHIGGDRERAETMMEKFRSQPRTTFITSAIANIFTPLISTVMKAKENGSHRAGALPVAKLQISGHGVRLADVVEGHHHDA